VVEKKVAVLIVLSSSIFSAKISTIEAYYAPYHTHRGYSASIKPDARARLWQ